MWNAYEHRNKSCHCQFWYPRTSINGLFNSVLAVLAGLYKTPLRVEAKRRGKTIRVAVPGGIGYILWLTMAVILCELGAQLGECHARSAHAVRSFGCRQILEP